MRTITGVLNGSTIEAPEYNSFAFAPNLLTVTLNSSNFSATQQVTVALNGITLARNCINYVAVFDLNALFQSLYNTDFPLVDTNASPDPFAVIQAFASPTITADEYTYELLFTNRWGALQFDETIADTYPTALRFPFWAGMPLLLNSESNYTGHDAVGSTITAVFGEMIKIPTTQTAEFNYITYRGGEGRQQTTFYPASCPTGRYLRWVDTHGRLWHYMFHPNKNDGMQMATSAGNRILRYPKENTVSTSGNGVILSKAIQRTFSCSANVERDILHIVASIAGSPFVQWYTQGRWVRVNVANGTFPFGGGYLSEVEITVELPANYIQRI
jgi:hypothetical protein